MIDRRIDDRGQTLNDYTMGISVFLLAVAFVVAFVPSIFAPFTAPIDDETTARADRGATRVLTTLSEDDARNVLSVNRTKSFFEDGNATTLRESLGVPATSDVNVSVVDPGTGEVARIGSPGIDASAGVPISDGPTAAATRVVVLNDSTYHLTVRVW